tara:strand:- start:10 stop:198 length:189 start_codon:yes stop_codon:yes gene_type:complete
MEFRKFVNRERKERRTKWVAEGSGVGGVGSEGMVIACIRLPLLVLLVYFLLIVQRVRTVYFF